MVDSTSCGRVFDCSSVLSLVESSSDDGVTSAVWGRLDSDRSLNDVPRLVSLPAREVERSGSTAATVGVLADTVKQTQRIGIILKLSLIHI